VNQGEGSGVLVKHASGQAKNSNV